MSRTPRLGLPMIMAAQAQKHITHNEALAELDVLTQLTVESRTRAEPPTEPQSATAFIVPDEATGAWAGHRGSVAAMIAGAWRIFQPEDGWRAFIRDEAKLAVMRDGEWRELGGPTGPVAQSDLVTRLSVDDLPDAVPGLAGRLILLDRPEEVPVLAFCNGSEWRAFADQSIQRERD